MSEGRRRPPYSSTARVHQPQVLTCKAAPIGSSGRVIAFGTLGAMAHSLRRFFGWLGSSRLDSRAPSTCPICGAELVGPYPAGGTVRESGGLTYLAPTREELIAKCPTHGHAPYNAGP